MSSTVFDFELWPVVVVHGVGLILFILLLLHFLDSLLDHVESLRGTLGGRLGADLFALQLLLVGGNALNIAGYPPAALLANLSRGVGAALRCTMPMADGLLLLSLSLVPVEL